METFGQDVKTKADFPSEKIIKLRYDLIKEELAVENNFFVLRVLQKDVFEDKNDWQTYLTTELNKVFAKKYDSARVITSSSSEYNQGIYKRFRANASFF